MHLGRTTILATICATVVACANPPPPRAPLVGPDQTLSLQTDPPGATCTVVQGNQQLGAVQSPGVVVVRRRKADLVVTCAKPGYVAEPLSWPVEPAPTHYNEAGTVRQWSFGAKDAAGLATVAFYVLPPASIVAWMIALPFIDTPQDDLWPYHPPDDLWAYSDLPTILLAPATFRTQGERDEYFDALRGHAAQAAQAEIERIDAGCRASCKASDKSCPATLCKRQHDAVVERTREQLNRVDVLRGRISVEIP